MDNSEAVQRAMEDRRCLFGTVDSWLLYVMKCPIDSIDFAAMLKFS